MPGPSGLSASNRSRSCTASRPRKSSTTRSSRHISWMRMADVEGGLEQALDQRLGQRVGHPHGEPERPGRGPPLQRAEQVLSEREDLVGVPEHRPSHVGEDQFPADPVEQLLAQDLLQPPDLSADGRLRQPKLGAGPHDAAIAGHRPEVQEVMIVQPLHAGTIPRVLKPMGQHSEYSNMRPNLPTVDTRGAQPPTIWRMTMTLRDSLAITTLLLSTACASTGANPNDGANARRRQSEPPRRWAPPTTPTPPSTCNWPRSSSNTPSP